jgi:MFS family permease
VAGLPWKAAGVTLTALLVIRFGMGLVTAPVYPAASRMVSWWVPWRQRAFANGMIQAAAAVGMACAFPLFGALVDAWDWPSAFLISGGLTIILGLVWVTYASDRPSQSPATVAQTVTKEREAALAEETLLQERKTSWWSPLRNRSVLLLTISYAAIGYLEYLFFFWMNHYFDKILHIEKERSRIYTAILLLSLGAGMIAGGWLADRLRRSFFGPWVGFAMVPMAGMTLGAISLGMGVLGNSITEIIVWLGLAMFAVGATEAPTWTAAVELGGRHGGTAAAIVNTGGNLGGFIAPFLTPIVAHAVRDGFSLSEQAGWQWGISLAGVFCLSGAILWWWIRPREQDV